MDDAPDRARRIVQLLVLVPFALIPLFYLPQGYQFANLPKLFLLQLFALSAAGVQIGLAVSGRSTSPPIFVLLFAVWVWAQWSRSLNPDQASIPLFVLTGGVALAFGAVRLFEDGQRHRLIRVVVFTAGCVSAIGVLESWGISWAQLRSAGRPSATMGFRNTAATYAIGCLPWCVYLMTRNRRVDRVGGVVTSALVLLFVLYTRSRGAWLGAVVAAAAGGGWYLYNVVWEGGDRPSGSTIGKVVAGLTVVVLLGSVTPSFEDASPSRLDEKKQSIPETVRSLTIPGGDRDRLTVWRHTAEMALDHALLGVGAGNWSAYYPRYDRGDVLHINSAPKRPHNDLLWIWAEVGLPGIFVYLLVLGGACVNAVRCREPWRIAAACSLLAIAVHSTFSFPREQAAPSLILWFSVAMCFVGTGDRRRSVAAASWVILALACAFGAGGTMRAIRADRAYADAVAAQATGNTSLQRAAALESLTNGAFDHRIYLVLGDAQVSEHDYEGAVETYTRYDAIQPYLGAAGNNLGNALNAVGDYAAAEAVLSARRKVLPNDRTLLRNLSEAYRRQGRLDAAIDLYSDAGPWTADDHQNLGLLFAELDSLDRALSHYDEALRLEPDRRQIVYSKAGIHLLQGRLEEAIAGYTAYLDSPDPNPTLVRRSRNRLRQAYVALATERMEAGDANGAVEALQHRVRLGEMTAEVHHTLAIAYGKAGSYGRAEDEARMALRLDGSMTIARLTLANALFSQRKREAFDHYARFVEDWEGDPRLREVAEQRLSRLRQ